MTPQSTWESCAYAGRQHCPCDSLCPVAQALVHSDDEAVQVCALEEEVRTNGLGRVLKYMTRTSGGREREQLLQDVAKRLSLKKENQSPAANAGQQIMNTAEILSVLLYTGTDVQGVARQDMMRGGNSWPVFAATLERALKKQRMAGTIVKQNHFDHDLILYHGLHAVNVKDFEKIVADDGTFSLTFSLGTFVSATYNRDTALAFACGAGGTGRLAEEHHKGLMLELCFKGGRWPACADVAWISKFNEEEVVVA